MHIPVFCKLYYTHEYMTCIIIYSWWQPKPDMVSAMSGTIFYVKPHDIICYDIVSMYI